MVASDHYRAVNAAGWDRLSIAGCDSSVPYGAREFRRAQQCLDGRGWLPWDGFARVLCLAAGGGQQGPLFASLGYEVTVFDLSGEQLRRDRETAARHGLQLRCVQGDMLDLSALPTGGFDLVYQPVSSLYVPDVRACYRAVGRVLRPGGLYYTEHWNPVQMQVSWDGAGYRLVHRCGARQVWSSDGARCAHFVHSLDDLIGGLCAAGFMIVRFAERVASDDTAVPGSDGHLATFVPTFFATLARRRGDGG